ncbi:MAG: hypothetical protein JW874_09790 [Spirochaetales bacterium]|nr:hypothetical protein [Spirochaetales bacterium]
MMEGMISGKKPLIQLPAMFFLTESGIEYCIKRKIPVRDLKNHIGRVKSGFSWEGFNAKLVQHLVSNMLIDGIEINRSDFLSKRNEIIDLTKLIVYAILYKKIKPTLKEILYSSDLISRLRRNNPRAAVNNQLKFDPGVVNKFMEENAKAIRTLKAGLLYEPYSLIQHDETLTEEQKKSKMQITQKFVDVIEPDTWFLFHYISRSGDKMEVFSRINSLLVSFVQKTKIADYIALMLLEILQNAEKTHFENLAIRDNMARAPGVEIDELLKDEDFRRKLRQKAETNKIHVNLGYILEGNPTKAKDRQRLTISVANKGLMGELERRTLQKRAKTEVKSASLADFFTSGDQDNIGGGLGLLYLSYLEDACKSEDIVFDARIISDDQLEETVATVHISI